jgi:hypothetical protein
MRSRFGHYARVAAQRVVLAGPEARVPARVRLQIFQWLVTVIVFAVAGLVIWGYDVFRVVTFALVFALVILLADPIRDAHRRRQQRRSALPDR